MKRTVILAILILSMLPVCMGQAQAAKKKKRPLFEEKIKTEAGPDAEGLQSLKKKKAQETLEAREWIIYLTPAYEQKTKPQIDILTFSDEKLSSKNLLSKGYPESPYSLTIEGDEDLVWETMQTNTQGDLVFWRGELKGRVIQGIASMLQKNGAIEDFYFTTAVPEVE